MLVLIKWPDLKKKLNPSAEWILNHGGPFAVTKYANACACLMAILLVHISHLSLVILARFTHFIFPNEGFFKIIPFSVFPYWE